MSMATPCHTPMLWLQRYFPSWMEKKLQMGLFIDPLVMIVFALHGKKGLTRGMAPNEVYLCVA
jgi:hypothetical protein